MHLLNTVSKKLVDFSFDPPTYAILSHRWRQEEVTFQDLAGSDAHRLVGYQKLSKACDIAREYGFKYLWMDTCCINKESSAELSEAINSMYMWYQKAGICFAYLDDVTALPSSLEMSEWFKRGWTLQELIAPQEVIFYANGWRMVGTKTSLAARIEKLTGIDQNVLLTGIMDGICVSRKMSWAAYRKTTRLEDEAYSLMGIFEINMPTIYGEGRNAFMRLQEEILKKSDDQSIFAWGAFEGPDGYSHKTKLGRPTLHPAIVPSRKGMLATSPFAFRNARDIVRTQLNRFEGTFGVTNLDVEFAPTNHGIRMRLPKEHLDTDKKTYLAYLACEELDKRCILAIWLEHLGGNRYSRINDYGEPKIFRVSYPTILPSNVNAEDWMFLVKDSPNALVYNMRITLNIQRLFDFCEKWGYSLSYFATLRSGSALTWSPIPSPGENCVFYGRDEGLVFLLKNESSQVGLLLVIQTQEHRQCRAEKNFLSVKIRGLSDREVRSPYILCISTDITDVWGDRGIIDQPGSALAVVNLWKSGSAIDELASDMSLFDRHPGKRVLAWLACHKESKWNEHFGYNEPEFTLVVKMLESV